MTPERLENLKTGTPPEQDPTSPYYAFQQEHERLSSLSATSIDSPSLTPRLPAPIAYFTGMSGPLGRDTFYISGMRRRAETLGRQMTPIEAAVLTRYTKNLQTSAEYLGLIGIVAGIARANYTPYYPGEAWARQVMGQNTAASGGGGGGGGGAGGAGGSAAAAGQNTSEGGRSWSFGIGDKRVGVEWKPGEEAPGEAGSSSKPPAPTGEAAGSTAPKEPSRPTPSQLQKESFKLLQEAVTGKPEGLPDIPEELRKLASHQAKLDKSVEEVYERGWPQKVKQMQKIQNDKFESIKPEHRSGFTYNIVAKLRDFINLGAKQLADAVVERKADLESRAKEAEKMIEKEYGPEMLEKFRDYKNKQKEHRDSILKRSNAIEAEYREATKQAKEASQPKSSGSSSPWAGRPQVSEGIFGQAKHVFRVGCWAVLGKYFVTAMGMTFLSMRARSIEEKDERLQEYYSDKFEYARARVQEHVEKLGEHARRRAEMSGRPLPPRPQPQQQSDEPSSPQDTKFEQDDGQSLGGLQTESIMWGDSNRDDQSSASQESGDNMSAWERARRGLPTQQQPAQEPEEDRYSLAQPEPRREENLGSSSSTGESVWDKIRRQTSSDTDSGREKRVPGEPQNSSDFGGWDKNKQREHAQKEFDAQLEKERKGGSDGWGS